MQFKFGQWQQSIYWCENENFMDFTGTCYRPKHWSSTHVQAKPAFTTWLNLSFIDLWVNRESIRTNQHVQEQSVCSDSCWVAWPLYKLCARSLAWFWINSYKSSRTVAMISNVTKPHRDLHWMIKLLLLIQRFFEQYLSENIIHFVIDQPSTALCTKLQVLSSDFSEISDLLNEHWPKNVPKESRSTPICVWLMICVDQNFAVKNIDVSCQTWLISTGDLSNTTMKI